MADSIFIDISELEQSEALVQHQQTIIREQSTRINTAVDMLEELTYEDDVSNNTHIENIIGVLMHGE